MAASTDADYNAISRSISFEIDMYIFGNDQLPLTITKNNYLIDLDVLEEAFADGSSLFGSVTSNELSFTLYNQDGMFSPTNSLSPYYGYMKKGVKCEVFVKVASKDRDSLGVFYITDWTATITGITASIVANDIMYDIFNRTDVPLQVLVDISYTEFFTQIFGALNITAAIDSSMTNTLHMSYNNSANSDLLTAAAEAAMALCYCGHTGQPTVVSAVAPKALRATITDADQIISAEASFSLSAGYSGASVSYYTTQESAAAEVLRVEPFSVPAGLATSAHMLLSKVPMTRLTYAGLVGTAEAYIRGIAATSHSLAVTTVNAGSDPVSLTLTVQGTGVETTASAVGDVSTDNTLTIDNVYVQSIAVANSILTVLRRYINSAMPVLTVQIRGNPRLNIGDKIIVSSSMYNLYFTGIIIRQEYAYNGALNSTLTLLDASLLEV